MSFQQPSFQQQVQTIGAGLGLTIAYNLVIQRFGGDIKVKSILGEGTSFTLDLPKKRPEEYQI